MTINFESNILRSLPQQVSSNACEINHTNYNYLAWKSSHAETAAEAFAHIDYAITGGTVYGKHEGTYFSIGDEWSFFQNDLTWQEYKLESIKKAVQFIQKNRKIMGDDYYYLFIPNDQHLFTVKKILPPFFDDELCYFACTFGEMSTHEVAWKYGAIRQVIQCYLDHNYDVIGGDYYVEVNGKTIYASESWTLKDVEHEGNNMKSADTYLRHTEKFHLRTDRPKKDLYVIVAGKW